MKNQHRKYHKTYYALIAFDERDLPHGITEGTKHYCQWSAKKRMKEDARFCNSFKRVAIVKCKCEEVEGYDNAKKGWVKS